MRLERCFHSCSLGIGILFQVRHDSFEFVEALIRIQFRNSRASWEHPEFRPAILHSESGSDTFRTKTHGVDDCGGSLPWLSQSRRG